MIEELKQHKKQLITLGVIVIIIVIGLLFLQQSRAVVRLTVAQEGARIFVDERQHSFTDSPFETIDIRLSSGTHSILVAADGRWPWKKEITLSSGETYPLSAFVMPQQPRGEVIKQTDERYNTIVQAITDTTVANTDDPLLSDDAITTLWADGEQIKAEWRGDTEQSPPAFCRQRCTEVITVHTARSDIRSLAFYPGRDNVVIYAAADGIFVIDMDTADIQNIQPIYTGIQPTFALPEENGQRIFVQDTDGTVMQLSL